MIPYAIDVVSANPIVRWIEAPDNASGPLPFFSRLIQRQLDARRPQRLTTLDALLQFHGADPAALVLHESRCGSTLVSQSLAECGALVSVSEATPVSQLLVIPGVSADDRVALLRGLVRALVEGMGGNSLPGLVKFTSWNVLLLPVIRAAFPDTPWVFVYRDPLEVLASHAQRPAQWLARPALLEHLITTHDFAVAADSAEALSALDETRRCAALIAAFGRARHHPFCKTHLVEPALHIGERGERASLRCERKAVGRSGIIQWPDSQSVHGAEHPVLAYVPDDECEFSNEMCRAIRAPPAVRQRDEYAVGHGVTLRRRNGQRGEQLAPIIDAGVRRNYNVRVGHSQRQDFMLRFRRDPLHLMAERRRPVDPHTTSVRPAVGQRVHHPAQLVFIGGTPVEPRKAGDGAHCVAAASMRPEACSEMLSWMCP